MSNSVRPHRRQPTRLSRPWDSPGKNVGVGCHFLLQCIKVKSESEVAQLCRTPSDPMDCSLPGSSVHGIFQARVLERTLISHLLQNKNSTLIYFLWPLKSKLCIFQCRKITYIISKMAYIISKRVMKTGRYYKMLWN